MLSTLKNRKEQGFTIIEVLIVLAIAGLILLVVFLAVPALQRNARNTSRKEDVASIMGGVSEFVNNNNGNLPTAKIDTDANTLTLGLNGTNQVPVSLGYYAPSDVNLTTFTTNGTNNNTTTDTVTLVTSAKCDPDDADIGKPVAGSTRAIVALYTSEPNGKQCSES
ncbi:MAG TPA: type II secretion system protein [Candidatus Saccharimonadales bacterium]|nr:type II secretion system protein [Candidatus Saccharimonadales bacterium]